MGNYANLSRGSTVPKSGRWVCEWCGKGVMATALHEILKTPQQLRNRVDEVRKKGTIKFFEAGTNFTECPNCGPATGWTILEEVVPVGQGGESRAKSVLSAEKPAQMGLHGPLLWLRAGLIPFQVLSAVIASKGSYGWSRAGVGGFVLVAAIALVWEAVHRVWDTPSARGFALTIPVTGLIVLVGIYAIVGIVIGVIDAVNQRHPY